MADLDRTVVLLSRDAAEFLEINPDAEVFDGWYAEAGFEVAMELSLQVELQSPDFLYMVEHGDGSGASIQPLSDWELDLDYSYVDSRAEQELFTRPGGSNSASDLPDVDTRLHHVEAGATWHVADDVSLRLDYQYYSYESDDWSWEDVQANTLDKVLTFGQENPDEDIHYVGASVIYRWQ